MLRRLIKRIRGRRTSSGPSTVSMEAPLVPSSVAKPLSMADWTPIDAQLYTDWIPLLRTEIQAWLNGKAPPPNPEALGPDIYTCLLYTSPSPRDLSTSRMPSSA